MAAITCAAQPGKHWTRAPRETLRERHQQGALAAEALHQPARRDAGFLGDVGQRELVRTAPAHDALGRGKHLFVRDLLWASRHGIDNF